MSSGGLGIDGHRWLVFFFSSRSSSNSSQVQPVVSSSAALKSQDFSPAEEGPIRCTTSPAQLAHSLQFGLQLTLLSNQGWVSGVQ